MEAFVLIVPSRPHRTVHFALSSDASTIVEAALGVKRAQVHGYDVVRVSGDGVLLLKKDGQPVATLVPKAVYTRLEAEGAFGPRSNPTTYRTPEGKHRTLTPENCPSHLAASMLSEQHWYA